MNMAITQAEYIWLDGAAPVQRLRSKSRIVALSAQDPVFETFPEWSFDGSSTYQASGNDSDLLLRPVSCIKDPLRGEGNSLVLCEVFNSDGTPHTTNTRAHLRRILAAGAAKEEPWIGFEQEYTLLWFVGSIRLVVPSPPPMEFQFVPDQLRREPLSCAPPLMRERSCRDTATV